VQLILNAQDTCPWQQVMKNRTSQGSDSQGQSNNASTADIREVSAHSEVHAILGFHRTCVDPEGTDRRAQEQLCGDQVLSAGVVPQ
jgi:hypothetical protein